MILKPLHFMKFNILFSDVMGYLFQKTEKEPIGFQFYYIKNCFYIKFSDALDNDIAIVQIEQ